MKVSTLEEFKLPNDFSTSALSTPKKWKVDTIVTDSFTFLTNNYTYQNCH